MRAKTAYWFEVTVCYLKQMEDGTEKKANEIYTIDAMQQICGLKTVTIYSGDRSTPKLDIIGVKNDLDLVSLVRERVELNRRRKGIYEITNR